MEKVITKQYNIKNNLFDNENLLDFYKNIEVGKNKQIFFNQNIKRVVNESINLIIDYSKPIYQYKIIPATSNTIKLINSYLRRNTNIINENNSEFKIIYMILTINKYISNNIENLSKTKAFDAYIMNSYIDFFLYKIFCNIKLELIKSIFKISPINTICFYPGNCYLDIEFQNILANNMNLKELDLTINKNLSISPSKTITANIIEDKYLKMNEYNCKTCMNKKCISNLFYFNEK